MVLIANKEVGLRALQSANELLLSRPAHVGTRQVDMFYPRCSPLRCPDQASPLYIRPVNRSAQCVGIVPATTEASVLLSRPAFQPTYRPSLHVCCVGHPQVPRQCTCFCPRGACKHYLSAYTLHGNKRRHAISLLLHSLITSIIRLRHGTEFSVIVDSLNQISFKVFSLNSTL